MKKQLKKNTKKISKEKIYYIIILIIDILITIFSARRNKVNYATINGKKILIGKTRYLLFGRNYITLLTSFIVYMYILILNKKILEKHLTKKNIIVNGLLLLLLNIVVFYIFTKKVY